jgi:hypothetical protein
MCTNAAVVAACSAAVKATASATVARRSTGRW